MNIETEVSDIKQYIIQISKKIDDLLYERETVSMMKLAERSLSGFLENEPNVYKIEDLKAKYTVSCKNPCTNFFPFKAG